MEESKNTAKPLIEQSGHTQKSFAEALRLNYSTIKFYVARQKMPGSDVLADMCRVLNQSPKTVMTALGINTAGIPDDSPN
jgi:orotate phosphoribosyltransferase-like protein